MSRVRCALLILSLLSIGPRTAAVAAERPATDLRVGEAAYRQSCARCHGVTGKGDGVEAKRFYPRPRDLTLGVYKFRSTASGTPPTDEDLFTSVTHGLPGTNMPDWLHLDEATRWQLVAYLKSLSPVFEQPPQPLQVAADPGAKRADLAKGRALYEQLGCAACHGVAGRANGMSAAGLVDDWGMPIRPANLTHGWAYRGGSDARAVMLRLLSGIDGAGMPSYAEAISPEDAWHLAYYVVSLQEPPQWCRRAQAHRVEGGVPGTMDDVRWRQAEVMDVVVRHALDADGTWAQPATVQSVRVEMLHDGSDLALRVTWDDPTPDRGTPPDALALCLKPSGAEGDVVSLQVWPFAGSPRLDMSYWSADTQETVERVVGDFSSLLARTDPAPPTLTSQASYEEGRWRLVLRRPLAPSHPEAAAQLTPDRLGSMAVAIWDGGNPVARAVSPWVDVALTSDE